MESKKINKMKIKCIPPKYLSKTTNLKKHVVLFL